jgi:hypothetical protein
MNFSVIKSDGFFVIYGNSEKNYINIDLGIVFIHYQC